MTLPRMLALVTYWQRYPPVHESVASFLGLGVGAPVADAGSQDDDPFDTLMQDFNGLG